MFIHPPSYERIQDAQQQQGVLGQAVEHDGEHDGKILPAESWYWEAFADGKNNRE